MNLSIARSLRWARSTIPLSMPIFLMPSSGIPTLQAKSPITLTCSGPPLGRTSSSTTTLGQAAKEGDLLDAIDFPFPKLRLRLLRTCAGLARLVHSMRCNPPVAQSIALSMFDGMARRSFNDFTGLHPTALQWQQASGSLLQGWGFGLCL